MPCTSTTGCGCLVEGRQAQSLAPGGSTSGTPSEYMKADTKPGCSGPVRDCASATAPCSGSRTASSASPSATDTRRDLPGREDARLPIYHINSPYTTLPGNA